MQPQKVEDCIDAQYCTVSWGDNILAYAVAPGFVRTDMVDTFRIMVKLLFTHSHSNHLHRCVATLCLSFSIWFSLKATGTTTISTAHLMYVGGTMLTAVIFKTAAAAVWLASPLVGQSRESAAVETRPFVLGYLVVGLLVLLVLHLCAKNSILSLMQSGRWDLSSTAPISNRYGGYLGGMVIRTALPTSITYDPQAAAILPYLRGGWDAADSPSS